MVTNMPVGDLESNAPYDCDVGLETWLQTWPLHQQLWCCSNEKKGCPQNAAFRCVAGQLQTAPFQQKAWCCVHKNIGDDCGSVRSQAQQVEKTVLLAIDTYAQEAGELISGVLQDADVDRNGQFSKDEFAGLLLQCKVSIEPDVGETMFVVFDDAGDEQISVDELIQAAESASSIYVKKFEGRFGKLLPTMPVTFWSISAMILIFVLFVSGLRSQSRASAVQWDASTFDEDSPRELRPSPTSKWRSGWATQAQRYQRLGMEVVPVVDTDTGGLE